MTTRKTRAVLGAAVALLIIVLALFALALLRANSDERAEAENRFKDRARVSAALTESIFRSTSPQSARENVQRYGDAEVDPRDLTAQVRRGSLAYAVVLDAEGKPLASSAGTPPAALRRILTKPPDVQKALDGQQFFLSDFLEEEGLEAGVMEFAAPFDTPFGRRVIVQGFPAQLIYTFLGGYLGQIPGPKETVAYILDSNGRVVGSPAAKSPPGREVNEPGLIAALKRGREGTFESAGEERYFASWPVGGSTWRVVLSARTDRLYAGISSTVEWLILLALALAGLVAVALLARAARAAAAVEEANARLAASNAELEHSNFELQRSNAELEQFASVASHDLQEPLRKVQTFGDQLERRFGESIPDEGLDYLRRMRRSAHRMSTLIEDLLRFSRVTTHARPAEPVDLARIAREVTSDLEAPLQEARGTVHIGALPEIEADPLQMRQLLQNLIANGIKFRRPGLEPEVRLEPVPAPGPGSIAFTVTDNGIGFEQEYADRIFRVFERLHPRDVYEGTGIGLAMCRKIVERHGGRMTADGRPGEGARFTVVLPRRQPLPPVPNQRPTDSEPAPEPAHA